jgi:hypothetical protein
VIGEIATRMACETLHQHDQSNQGDSRHRHCHHPPTFDLLLARVGHACATAAENMPPASIGRLKQGSASGEKPLTQVSMNAPDLKAHGTTNEKETG